MSSIATKQLRRPAPALGHAPHWTQGQAFAKLDTCSMHGGREAIGVASDGSSGVLRRTPLAAISTVWMFGNAWCIDIDGAGSDDISLSAPALLPQLRFT